MSDKDYSWDGDWEGPGHGSYVILNENDEEIEPYQVIEKLRRLADLEEQLARTARLKPKNDDTVTPEQQLEYNKMLEAIRIHHERIN